MSRILPEQVLGIVGSYLEYVSTSPSRQLLVFSLIFSVWFPLRATSCLMHSVRKAYGVPQPPSMIGGTLRNLVFTLWLIVTIAASIVLTTVGRRALQFVSGLIHIPDQFINVGDLALCSAGGHHAAGAGAAEYAGQGPKMPAAGGSAGGIAEHAGLAGAKRSLSPTMWKRWPIIRSCTAPLLPLWWCCCGYI